MTGEPKLKPCPFCGAKGEYKRASPEWYPEMWTAGCPDGHAMSTDMPTKKEAADWWNKRRKPLKKGGAA